MVSLVLFGLFILSISSTLFFKLSRQAAVYQEQLKAVIDAKQAAIQAASGEGASRESKNEKDKPAKDGGGGDNKDKDAIDGNADEVTSEDINKTLVLIDDQGNYTKSYC